MEITPREDVGEAESIKKEELTPKVKTILEVLGYARGREAGRKEGFQEGVRYVVTMAEENLAKFLKLSGREALANSGQIPGWWLVSLVTALGIDELPADVILKEGDQ